jgi:hypothetical protein
MSTRVRITMSKARTERQLRSTLRWETHGVLPTHLEWTGDREVVATFTSEEEADAVLSLGGGVKFVKKTRYEFTVSKADVSCRML